MTAELRLARKDARLAATVAVPAAAVIGGVAVVCLFGHLIPALGILFGLPSDSSPIARLQPVVYLLVIASFVVPAWCAVTIVLGDRQRSAAMLAAAAPLDDRAKVVSKLLVMLVSGASVCVLLALATWLIMRGVSPILRDGISEAAPAGPLLAVFGVLSGVSAALFAPRVLSAMALSIVLPLAGLLFALPAALIFVQPWWFDADIPSGLLNAPAAAHYSDARLWAVGAGVLATDGLVLIVVAWRALPLLAGRQPRRQPLRMLIALAVAAALGSSAVSVAVTAFHPDLRKMRQLVAEEVQMRSRIAAMDDDALINAFIADWPDIPLHPRELFTGVALESLRRRTEPFMFTVEGTGNAWMWRNLLRAEFDNRARRTDSAGATSIRAAVQRRTLDAEHLDVATRLRLARLPVRVVVDVNQIPLVGTYNLTLAKMLNASTSDLEHVAITAALADERLRAPQDSDYVTDTWPLMVRLARAELQGDLRMWASYATPEDVRAYRLALQQLGRPMPQLAAALQARLGSEDDAEIVARARAMIDALARGVPQEDQP